MNYSVFQPLTENHDIFTGNTDTLTQTSQVSQPNNNANQTNNSLNTFQDIATDNANATDMRSVNEIGKAISKATESNDSSSSTNKDDDSSNTAASDFRLKIIDNDRLDSLLGNHDLLDAISDLNAYKFRYKEGADKIDPDATPDKERVGVMAQELKENPVTESTVEEDPLSGFLKVNTKELTLTTFALVTDMAKRIKALEARLSNQ